MKQKIMIGLMVLGVALVLGGEGMGAAAFGLLLVVVGAAGVKDD